MDSPLLPLENHALRSDLSRSPKVSSHIRHFSGLHKTELLTSLLFKLSVILEILTLLCELRLLLGQSLLLLQKQSLLLADLIEMLPAAQDDAEREKNHDDEKDTQDRAMREKPHQKRRFPSPSHEAPSLRAGSPACTPSALQRAFFYTPPSSPLPQSHNPAMSGLPSSDPYHRRVPRS